MTMLCGQEAYSWTDDAVATKFGELTSKHPDEFANLSVLPSTSLSKRTLTSRHRDRLAALKTIQRVRRSDYLEAILESAAAQRPEMSIDEAYNRLGVSGDTPDDVVLSAYDFIVRLLPLSPCTWDKGAHESELPLVGGSADVEGYVP